MHRSVGAAGEEPVSLASVRLDAGPVVIARLDGDADAGTRVVLAFVARATRARPR